MKRFEHVVVFSILFVTCCGNLFAQVAEGPGRELYMKYCSSCHGERLQGGNAQSLVDGVWQFGAGRGAVSSNVRFGIQNLGMPSFDKTLTGREINQIIDFLMDAERAAAPKGRPLPTELETLDYKIDVSVFADGLDTPWAIDFIDANHALITERVGRLRQVVDGKLLAEPVAGTPKVVAEGQGGLLDVAVGPAKFADGWIYLSYSHGVDGAGGNRVGAMTRIVRGKIKDNAWVDEQVVYEAPHDTYRGTRHHYGSRVVFDTKGYVYFGIGDRGSRPQAQELERPNGKVHRLFCDGRVPKDNPFVNVAGALDSIYAYGIRNPQGMAVHPVTDGVWENEHGPLGGDEVNLIESGKNYGWAVISYGFNYDGTVFTNLVEKEGMEQPVYYWRPSIAVCGMDFVRGDLFGKWRNLMLVGALKYEEVRLLDVKNDRVMHDEVILKNAGRVRDVACGVDGAIYVVLNSPGTVLRLVPRKL